jgi:hypothetical protein
MLVAQALEPRQHGVDLQLAGDEGVEGGAGVAGFALGGHGSLLGVGDASKRIEQAVWRDLLTDADREAGLFAEFNVNALLRGDFKSRMEGYAIGRQWGWLSSNEVRGLENMNPRPGGEGDWLNPLNMNIGGKSPAATSNSESA